MTKEELDVMRTAFITRQIEETERSIALCSSESVKNIFRKSLTKFQDELKDLEAGTYQHPFLT